MLVTNVRRLVVIDGDRTISIPVVFERFGSGRERAVFTLYSTCSNLGFLKPTRYVGKFCVQRSEYVGKCAPDVPVHAEALASPARSHAPPPVPETVHMSHLDAHVSYE